MLYEDTVEFVVVRGWGRGCGGWGGDVVQGVVGGVDTRDAHLEFVRISRVVQRLFNRDESLLKQVK